MSTAPARAALAALLAFAAPGAARAQASASGEEPPPAVRLRNALLEGGNFEVQQQRQLSQRASYAAPTTVRFTLLDAGVTNCLLRFRGQINRGTETPVVHLYELPLDLVDADRIRTAITRPGVRLRLFPDPWDLMVEAVDSAAAPFHIEQVYPRPDPHDRDRVIITLRDRDAARSAAAALREVVAVCSGQRT